MPAVPVQTLIFTLPEPIANEVIRSLQRWKELQQRTVKIPEPGSVIYTCEDEMSDLETTITAHLAQEYTP